MVARYGVGVDAVDLGAARTRGVWVTNTPGANSEAVADLALALTLVALRGLVPAAARLRDGDWTARRGRELGATTVGIVGFGRIGQALAARLLGFGGRVVVHDPFLTRSPVPGVAMVDLETLARTSDVVSLHAPGGQVIADSAWISLLPPDAVIVNTARGDLVDEAAVCDALRGGHLSAYAADTLKTEHMGADASPLLADDLRDWVTITPHIGAQTAEAAARMGRMAAAAVLAVHRGDIPAHVVVNPLEDP